MYRLALSLLLWVCSGDLAACALGLGKRQWTQTLPSEPSGQSQSLLHGTFPPGFLWGTGTSAFQTEGAWDQAGKGPSIWDHFTHPSSPTETADVASDGFARWEEDVEALGYLGVRSYSFSLSWPRIFPDGRAAGRPDRAAVDHYSQLLDRLLEQRVEPVVTLHHWDLPQALQEGHGGWRNATLIGLFEQYAAFCFRTFGSRVRYWLTMHNPYLMAVQGYGTGAHAPGKTGGPSDPLIVAHNLIRAHAKAWHNYNTHFRPTQKGQVSIVLGSHWIVPQRGQVTAANVDLCQRSMEAVVGWFANPIFGNGDYPASMKATHENFLPVFTLEESLFVQGTADFFALSFGPNNLRLSQILDRYNQRVSPDLRGVLGWLRLEYGDQRVLVAEAGWFSDAAVGRVDTMGIYLMKTFVNQVLQAIKLDDVRVFGYTAWSLVDGFEWNYGYSLRRGLFYIDFSQPNRTRVPKTSAQYYRHIISDNGFPGDDRELQGRFPCDFHWGVADSTLQVHFYPYSPQFTDPHLYKWNLTGDGLLQPVSGVLLPTRGAQCTDYLSIKGHLRLFESTGASHYRFALNWSLILPQGDRSSINTEALRYYRCVLTELGRLDLKAVVILYYPTHRAPLLGLPQPLHASGGWVNQSTIEAFQDYAAICYKELGRWVHYWITINQPNRLLDAYPSGEDQHRATHNILLAHAKAWKLYKKEYSAQHGALVSLALHADWTEPANPFLESHTAASQRFLLFELGRFLDPLLGGNDKRDGRGSYPGEMRAYLEERARAKGLPGSPLPRFTEEEKEELSGALGFIALNHFNTWLVAPYPQPESADSSPNAFQRQAPDHGCLLMSDPTWPRSGLGQALVPWGLRKVLNWLKERYGGALPVIITEWGVDDQAPMEDRLRQHYLRSYLQEALKARQLDKVNLQGFYLWKLQDRHGPQFGLFRSPHYQSHAKASVAAYRRIIDLGGFPKDNVTGVCRTRESWATCAICARICENKPLFVFGMCLLVTAVMLGALIVIIIIRKRRARVYGRSRTRRRRSVGAPVCPAPLGIKCQPWERGTMRNVADRTQVFHCQ
ncbi:beta-klotho [Aplochiton taeniatus]